MQALVSHRWCSWVLGLSLWFGPALPAHAHPLPSGRTGPRLSSNHLKNPVPPPGLQVQCPSNITVYATNGQNGAVVTWSGPEAESDCPLCITSIPGCQAIGTLGGHTYFLTQSPTDWMNAAFFAVNHGGTLATISNELENQFVAQSLKEPTFIGLNDILFEGNYQWHSGEPYLYSRWFPGEPDNGQGLWEQDVVAMDVTGFWKDTEQDKPKPALIEVACVTVQQTAGLASGSFFPLGTTQVAYTLTDPCGQIGYCSFLVTVLPNITVDCPGDITAACQPGVNGAVVDWPLPTASTQCPDCGPAPPMTIDMGSFGGSHYYCTNSVFQWLNGEAFATSYGGHLASIGSSAENNWLKDQLQIPDAYIGLNDLATEGTFVWTSGEALSFTSWAPGQPVNLTGQEDVTSLLDNGKWTVIPKETYKECIVEVPCVSVVQIQGPAPGSVFPPGMTEVKYKFTDHCGNIAYCSFKVNVTGGVSLHCPDDVTLDCQPGKNGATYGWDLPELWSCCSDCPDGDPIPGFIYMGEFQGSHYYCSQQNHTWPIALALAQANGGHLAVLNSVAEHDWVTSKLMGVVAWIGLTDEQVEGQFQWITGDPLSFTRWFPGQPDNGGFSNEDYVVLRPDGFWQDELGTTAREFIMEIPCESVVQIAGPPSGSVFPAGTTIITYKGTDGCGQMATCSFSVTVKTCCLTPPEIQCPPDYHGCPDTPMDPSVTGWAMSWTPDGPCGKVQITWSDEIISQGNCWDKVIKRTWTAYFDLNPQLSSSCTQWIYLQDKEAPTWWDCPKDVTVAPGPDCCVHVGWSAPVPMDNCGLVQTTVSHAPGSKFCEGTTTVVYTFIDPCGNKSQCSFKVTVSSCCKAPAITCPPAYKGCPEESVSPLVTGFASSPTPDGPCGNVMLTFEDEVVSMGNCWDQTILRTWKATYDLQPALYATCTQSIVLEDKVPPQISDLPDDLTLCPEAQIPFGTPTVTDNCGAYTLTYKDVAGPGDCHTGQPVTRTWTAVDACGNKSTVSQTATILDNSPPVVWECPDDLTVDPDTSCQAVVAWAPPGVMDNCGPVDTYASHAPGSVFGEGVTVVTYTFQDACGNQADCSFKITVGPCCLLPGLQCPGKYQTCPGEPLDPSVAGQPDLVGASDCGLLDLTWTDEVTDSSGCPGSIKIGRTWTLTPVADPGKAVECVQWVQAVDDEPPLFDSCPKDIVVYTEEWCPVAVFWTEPQVTDNCSDFTLTATHYSGDTYYPGETEVQYWAEDVCGNTSFCIFTIEVIPASGSKYCESRGEDASSLWVEEIQLQGQPFVSGPDCGWGGQDALTLLAWGDQVDVTLVPGYGNEAVPAYLRAWVDWNRDGDFYDFGESVYDGKELGTGPKSFSFTVPDFAKAGPSVLRTVLKYTDVEYDSELPEPCGVFARGEVEDLVVGLGMVTSTEEPSGAGSIQVFPNPAHDEVQLVWSGPGTRPVQGEIVNVFGQKVGSWSWTDTSGDRIQVHTGNLPAGLYLMRIRTVSGDTTLPLVFE